MGSTALLAQPTIGIQGQLGFPANEYADNISTVGGGLNLNFAVPVVEDFPLAIGAGFGWMNIGNHEEKIREQLTISSPESGITFNVPLNYRIVTNSNFLHVHALARLRPPVDWPVVPYVEALGGFRYLYTRTQVIEETQERESYPDREVEEDVETVVAADTHINDWVLSYGYGGGFQFRLGAAASLDLNVQWLRGTNARYYDREDVSEWELSFTPDRQTQNTEEDGTLTVQASPRESTTDIFMASLGVTFSLD